MVSKGLIFFLPALLNAVSFNRTWEKVFLEDNRFKINIGFQNGNQDSNLVAFSPVSNSIFVAGSSSGISIDDQAPIGLTNPFLMKFDSDGTRIWTRFWGTGSPAGDFAYAVAVDESKDEIYVTGGASSLLPNSNFTFLANSGKTNSFLTKFDTNGNLLWNRMWGGIFS